jgi:hypothetical protein
VVWLRLFGCDAESHPFGIQKIATPFPFEIAAIVEGVWLAHENIFSFGNAVESRILGQDGVLLGAGSF